MDFKSDSLKAEQLEIIYNLTRRLTRVTEENDILQIILSELMKETGAEVGAFIYYDSIADEFVPRTIKKSGNNNSSSPKFSNTIFQKILKEKEAVLSFDIQSDDRYRGAESVLISNIHAVLAFPLIIENRVYGILYFDSRENRQGFNEPTRQLLSFFTPIASLILEQMPMIELFKIIHKVAKSDISVVITGENGTGKDLIARAIYELSPRRDNPFLAQYIGNIPGTILESELFGYKKGAFTGANSDKMGLFEAVNGGTLFLDEIGDLSPELQTKFLRVLQNKEIKRLGENTIRKVDVRIIAATNCDLSDLVRKGRFREDLYYRLNVINIKVPPLRERKSDIPLLIRHFLLKNSSDQTHQIGKPALRKLMDYNWPGNVRQLENILKRAVILANNKTISKEDIEFDEAEAPFSGTLEEYSNRLIESRLRQFNGNKSQAARSLGISLRSLQMKAKKLGL
ncbi:MAG: sigma-54-dependent Fis family transcriptional regulator [Calditrichia bacterium]